MLTGVVCQLPRGAASGCCSEFMLPVLSSLQVAQLGQLADLRLDDCVYDAASLAPLSRLAGSLTRLEVVGGKLPPCLSALGRLQRLDALYCQLGEEAADVLDSALQHLTRLTQLVSVHGGRLRTPAAHCTRVHAEGLFTEALGAACENLSVQENEALALPALQVLNGRGLTLPAALAGLSRLQRCFLCRTDSLAAVVGDRPQLPAGPWLRNLQWLGIDAGLLDGCVAALGTAPALEFVEVVDTGSQPRLELRHSPAAAAFFGWLAQHPPLARVSFETQVSAPNSTFASQAFAMRLLQLGRSRPGLRVRCSGGGGDFPESMSQSLMSD